MTAVVNGPEDDGFDWGSIDWPNVEGEVRSLRQRIFTASQAGDLSRVRSLQKLMLRSRSNALVSVRRVTEVNAGRKTAGVDGAVLVTAPGKAALVDLVRRRDIIPQARPVKRVYIARRTASSARSVFRRSAHSAKSSQPSEGSEFVVVTHPFHPLAGQRLEVLFERQMPVGLALSCDGGRLGRMLLPAAWTDRQDRLERPSRLSYEALVELAAVIGALGKP